MSGDGFSGKAVRFSFGRIGATHGALEALEDAGDAASVYLLRHVTGDWGELDPEDSEANELALEQGSRLLSAYKTSKGVKLWIITEADRSVTTLLLPEEY